MALTEAEVESALTTPATNRPMPAGRRGGARRTRPPRDSKRDPAARSKRELCCLLITQGWTREQVVDRLRGAKDTNTGVLMFPGLSIAAAEAMHQKCLRLLVEEKREMAPFDQALQRARVLGHIRKAAEDKQWSAVMNGEKIFSETQGTRSPIEADVRVTAGPGSQAEAVVMMIAGIPEARVLARVREHLIAEYAAKQLAAPVERASVIDTRGETLDEALVASTAIEVERLPSK